MNTKQQLHTLLNGYVTDRNTLASITVPENASVSDMLSLARQHGLAIDVGETVKLTDSCYTYAVVDGRAKVIAG